MCAVRTREALRFFKPAGTVWPPVAGPESSLARRAQVALGKITEELLESREDCLDSSLFFAYKARLNGNRRWMEVAVERLNTAIRGAESMWSGRRFGLYGGLAGLGFGIEQVTRCLNLKKDDADINRDTDLALLLELQRGQWRGDPYLANGLAGIEVYFLERLPLSAAMEGLELVIGHIEARFRRVDWADSPDGTGGLWGVAHFLTRAMDAGVDVVRTRTLLERMDQRLKAELLAWNGALGIAAVCFEMGRFELGRTLVSQCLLRDRPWKEPCAAEVAHTWNRVRTLYADSACYGAAVEAFDRMLTVCERPDTEVRRRAGEFFAGPAITGLVLMAAVTDVEPEWDRIVCLSGTYDQSPPLLPVPQV